MHAVLTDGRSRPRRSVFLIAATSFALTFTTLGMAPARGNQQDSSASGASEEAEISQLLVSYEPGVSPLDASGDITGQNYVPSVDFEDLERISKNVFTVDLPAPVSESEALMIADELEKSPQVKIVEPDYPITLSISEQEDVQSTTLSGLWGLDRIDQRSSELNGTYKFDNTGLDVNAYVIDTGIYPHNEFQDRLELGYDAVSNREDTDSQRFSTDCSANGHGTHVAGILGGTTFGVAKEVSLIPVRVFDCTGDAYTSDVIAGIDWAIDHHQPGELAVANMSLGGNKSSILDYWVKVLINDGVYVVVASGNSNVDACSFSPASTPGTITVNSSALSDVRSSFSNFGPCTDIFAPGELILSAGNSGPDSTRTISGTSMASPFVAGAVAKILEANPSFNRSQVISELLDSATPFVSEKFRDPPRLLYSPAPLLEQQELADAIVQAEIEANATEALRVQSALEAAELARVAAERAAAIEAARIAAEKVAAEKAAAEKVAAEKAARIAAEKAAAKKAAAKKAAAVRNAVKKSLDVVRLKSRKISIEVSAPKGSTTVIQRKVGKKWKQVTVSQKVGKKWKEVRVSKTRPISTIKVSRAGTYRVQIQTTSGTITTKSFRVR